MIPTACRSAAFVVAAFVETVDPEQTIGPVSLFMRGSR
jgi:hypothetical protein